MQFNGRFGSRTARLACSFSILALAASLSACGGGAETSDAGGEAAGGESVSGDIQIDGSSTVLPISEAMSEEFSLANPDVRVALSSSGSGGGFKKFCAGETDISNASRQIKEEEAATCEAAGIEFVEVPVAYDGITLVTNPANDWAACLTVAELNTMWAPEAEGQINNWSQINPEFPDAALELFGPGTDSGTFNYFNEEVNGDEEASRGDYTSNEDDNVIVLGVQGAEGALGYFGYAYYEENQDSLNAVAVENEDGECIDPSTETIADGSYNPMSRPLFIYVKKESYDTKPQVQAFVDYHLASENGELVKDSGYITLPDADLEESRSKVESM